MMVVHTGIMMVVHTGIMMVVHAGIMMVVWSHQAQHLLTLITVRPGRFNRRRVDVGAATIVPCSDIMMQLS